MVRWRSEIISHKKPRISLDYHISMNIFSIARSILIKNATPKNIIFINSISWDISRLLTAETPTYSGKSCVDPRILENSKLYFRVSLNLKANFINYRYNSLLWELFSFQMPFGNYGRGCWHESLQKVRIFHLDNGDGKHQLNEKCVHYLKSLNIYIVELAKFN